MESMKTVLKLPTTAETEEGPTLEHRPGSVTIRYDHEGETGAPEWVTIGFTGIAAFRLTMDPACTALMSDAYSEIGEVAESEWVREMLNLTEQSGMGLLGPHRHFVIYFDHYGCIEVVAASFEVEGVVDLPTINRSSEC